MHGTRDNDDDDDDDGGLTSIGYFPILVLDIQILDPQICEISVLFLAIQFVLFEVIVVIFVLVLVVIVLVIAWLTTGSGEPLNLLLHLDGVYIVRWRVLGWVVDAGRRERHVSDFC